MLCLVIKHGMTSLSFQTAVQKKEARMSSFVQFENENEQGETSYVLTVLEHSQKQSDVIAS